MSRFNTGDPAIILGSKNAPEINGCYVTIKSFRGVWDIPGFGSDEVYYVERDGLAHHCRGGILFPLKPKTGIELTSLTKTERKPKIQMANA